MKKLLLAVVMLMVLVSVSFGATWTDLGKFEDYKIARANAQQADADGNTKQAVEYYVQASELAKEFATPEIAGWQLNNAGRLLLLSYKLGMSSAILEEAKTLLDDAQEIAGECECTVLNEKIQNNLDAVNYWLTLK